MASQATHGQNISPPPAQTKTFAALVINPNNHPAQTENSTAPALNPNNHPAQPEIFFSPVLNPNNLPAQSENSAAHTTLFPNINTSFKNVKKCFVEKRKLPANTSSASGSVQTVVVPELPDIRKQFVETSTPTKVDAKKEKNMTPFLESPLNVCSSRNCSSRVTRLKHPNSNNKYKGNQQICEPCYVKEKEYQCLKHKETRNWRKNQQILGPVIGWLQQQPILWHHPAYLPSFVGTNQVMVGTFSSLFASQVLCLCRLAQGSSFKMAKKQHNEHKQQSWFNPWWLLHCGSG